MPEFDRILTAYEHRVRQIVDELVTEVDPTPEERAHLLLVAQLVQTMIHAYDSFQAARPTPLDASTSLMYAAAAHEGRGPLNVPLRSLVDSGTLTPAQARFLNGSLGMRRSILITGDTSMGKSTLLNALLGLLPGDPRMFVVREDTDDLPALRGKSFVVQVVAPRGTEERGGAFQRIGTVRPDWVVVDGLAPEDGPSFLQALSLNTGGLATVRVTDAQVPLIEWLGLTGEVAEHLAELNPLAVRLERDAANRPRVVHIVELGLKERHVRTADRSRL